MKTFVSTSSWNNSKLSNRHQNANVKGVSNPICACKFCLSSRPTYRAKSSLEGKNTLIGKIVGLHGKKGVVRAKFRKGVPGQALGTTVELVG